MMTAGEQILLNALVELDNAGHAPRGANPNPDLPALFARIDKLAKQLPHDADPNLLHYLQKKSYEKARRRLEGRAAEITRGGCR